MIDLHSHILPGIDDGAKTMEDSLNMARDAVVQGVTHIMCTPHVHLGIFDNKFNDIKTHLLAFKQALDENKITLKVSASCEIRVTPEILSWVADESLLYLGSYQDSKVILLELPHSHIPPGLENLLKWFKANNIKPVIPHPERNRDIQGDYSKLLRLRSHGCLFQVTAGSFIGRFNESSEDIANRMLENGHIDYIASDTHSVNRRPNDMALAKKCIEERYNVQLAKKLTYDFPSQLTANTRWL